MDKNVLKFDYREKLKIKKNIRHELKKKRFLLDESYDNFGFDEMVQLKKVDQTQVKGHPFCASKIKSKILNGMKVALKIVPIETKYEKKEHPSNLEFIVLKELTDNLIINNVTPHIAYYFGVQKVSNKSRALKKLNLKKLEVEEKIRTHSNMLISEYIEGGSLDNWVYDICENDGEISSEQWKILTFQMVYTLAILQQKYKMMHNDLHYGNILMDTSIKIYPGSYFVYEINNKKYYIKSTGVSPVIWDLEFCMVYSNKIPDFYPNKFIIGQYEYDRKTFITKEPILNEIESDLESDINVPYNYNEVYDLHYFLGSLLDLYISKDLFDWIVSIYPDELIPKDDVSTAYSNSNSSDFSSSFSSENSDKKKSVESEISGDSSDDDDTSSENDTSENSESTSENGTSSDSDRSDPYLSEGRMKNGVEKEFKELPTPMSLLTNNSFFDCFLTKPSDFDESVSYYFKAGF